MILQQFAQNRVLFDPSNKDHRSAFKIFINTGRWTMNFQCEHPHSSVVSTVERKLIEFSLRDITSAAEIISGQILADRASRKQKERRIGADVISVIGPLNEQRVTQ
jgi:hypothetical protein